MSTYIQRLTGITVLPEGEPIFSERATNVEIVDEAAGEFVAVSQGEGKIRIDPEEWVYLRQAIDTMVSNCAPIDKEVGK